MNDTLSESAVGQWVDDNGLHDAARGPGCYCLRLKDPVDDPHAIGATWLDKFDVHPPAGFSERAAAADRLVYVGSHGKSVYTRLCQHARGHKSSTIMTLWPPVDIVAIWPEESPDAMEWGYANQIADETTVAWTNGEYL